jgi:AcrR family transcriptional regulator
MAVETKRTRVTKAPEDRRRDLLDAGLRVLTEKGPEATVADIVAAAGVAKGTFYLYFDSKDDLVRSLRDRFTAEFASDMTTGVGESPEPGDWWRTLDRTVEKFVDFLLENQDVHAAVWHGVPGTNPTSPGQVDIFELLADFLRAGADAGAFAVADPPMTGTLLFGAVHGAVDIALGRGAVDRDRLVTAARELTHKVLAP